MENVEMWDKAWVKRQASRALLSPLCAIPIIIGAWSSNNDAHDLERFAGDNDYGNVFWESIRVGTETLATSTLSAAALREHLKARSKNFSQLEVQGTELQAGETFYPLQQEANRL